MAMPTKNIDFYELTPKAHVELRGDKNKYYVAKLPQDNPAEPWQEEGVVIMYGDKQREQQRILDQMCHDSKMRARGYKYRLTPKSKRFQPLYSKTLQHCGPLMREYPHEQFDTETIA